MSINVNHQIAIANVSCTDSAILYRSSIKPDYRLPVPLVDSVNIRFYASETIANCIN